MTQKSLYPGERNHLVLCSAIGFLLGCTACTLFPFGWWVWGLLTASVGLCLLLRLLNKKIGIAVLVAFFALGLLRTYPLYAQPVPQEGKYTVTGYVCGSEIEKENSKKSFILTDICLDGVSVSGRAYCTLNESYAKQKSPALFDGASVSFTGRVYHPQEKSGYPHFDFRRWMYENGTPFGISSSDTLIISNTREEAPVKDLASRIRLFAEEGLTPLLGDNTAVAMAILFGDRSGLEEEQYKNFQKLGIAHLMSVSGLHIGILAGMVMAVMKALHINRKLRLPFIMLFLFSYSALCGFSPSSLRAAIMFSAIYIGKLLFRARDRMTVLAFAALIILFINPLDAMSAGFILSFSAMLGIYAFTPLLVQGLEWIWPVSARRGAKPLRLLCRKAHQGMISSFALSMGAQLGAFFPTICFFHQMPTYGLLVNTLLVPFVGCILTPLLFITALLMSIPGLNTVLGTAGGLMCDGLIDVTAALAKLPGAVIRVATPNAFLVIGVVLSALLLTRLFPGKMKVKGIASAAVLVCCMTLVFVTRPASLRYIQLSAGQADSAIIMDADTTIAIDTGDDAGELLDYLLYEGRGIDALYITHPHSDHIGGLDELMDSGISIGKIYLPSGYLLTDVGKTALAALNRAAQEGISIEELSTGDRQSYHQCQIRLLWPDEGKTRSGTEANEVSMVLYIQLGNYSLLQMGDLGENYEHYAMLPANILKIAHHGSAYATQNDFLSCVSPDYAIISCSAYSRSLPSPKTLARLEESHIPCLRSDVSGDITLIPTKNALLVQPYRRGESQ